eukprot:CAMPEP_0170513820 /NCGR_PEP_ID=MMETSP0209-20121228/375_1 /TAXON_ID=665100 ORGANISM="Litonotus pictus, Strain P1" /NCGR_SAMPLE_ID=MMETSP0209 /ASSEMBLY_ACC=CAM_ASM_000301 /LENGTH=113 /DNA_ID=CAMNT_0010797641 /DNA_START=119 /DNA_END=456 /DNA_ORIENTATION=-
MEDEQNEPDTIELPSIASLFVTKKSMSTRTYLDRLVKYTQIEKSSLILAFMLLDKLKASEKRVIHTSTILKLLLTACVVSLKYNEDDIFLNSVYAKIGGVNLLTFNEMELVFL